MLEVQAQSPPPRQVPALTHTLIDIVQTAVPSLSFDTIDRNQDLHRRTANQMIRLVLLRIALNQQIQAVVTSSDRAQKLRRGHTVLLHVRHRDLGVVDGRAPISLQPLRHQLSPARKAIKANDDVLDTTGNDSPLHKCSHISIQQQLRFSASWR